MKSYIQLTKAQLRLFARNKNMLIWSLLLPIFMILAFGVLIGDENKQISLKMGIVDKDQTNSSQEFRTLMSAYSGFSLTDLAQTEGMARLKDGDLDAMIVIEKGFGTYLDGSSEQTNASVAVYLDESNPTVAQLGLAMVNQQLDVLNKRALDYSPIVTSKVVNIQANPLTYMDFLVPGILSLMIMTNNLNGVAATIASWRERGILRRMQGTPLKSSTFIAAQMTARILINSVQAVFVLLVAYFVFDVQVYGSWFTLLFFILLGTLTFMSMGFIVASLARTPETAAPIAGLISFPMIFVGGIFFPIRDLPGFLNYVVQVIPIGHLTEAIRGVMNEGIGIADFVLPTSILLAWTVVSFTIASLTFRWDVK
ncbi:ABC transporter permease [Hazenella sp. IB182357]|uniref:ABC transporter permease n=1 Tax=Polycladospora coralii TaxID=2771432 RepID=A0A926NEZ2_9BACL|nr:ABC transporter permease [Polycladospora coralii]MBD1372309.1 ABC transporter permease [Polycladospora coralii]MBS7531501.1 ABC transporter permease [Polycladospora coralii]